MKKQLKISLTNDAFRRISTGRLRDIDIETVKPAGGAGWRTLVNGALEAVGTGHGG
jgi:hypothetical protein